MKFIVKPTKPAALGGKITLCWKCSEIAAACGNPL